MKPTVAPSVATSDVPAESWLPKGKSGAVCFTIDDVHPGRSTDAYEAGGDLGRGALGHVERLLDRHPQAWVTLFVTPDWREISPVVTRKWLARVPLVGKRVMLTSTLRKGTMRLDRHPDFALYIGELPRTEVGLHGLHHVHSGGHVVEEFRWEPESACAAKLREALAIFARAGLKPVPGMQPPGWRVSPHLLRAMVQVGLRFVASARDVNTPISFGARANMSGLRGVSLQHPQLLTDYQLIHFTSNFQATSPIERAMEILSSGGLLAIKGHIVKDARGFIALDGMDSGYAEFLDRSFSAIEDRFGSEIWWTSMGQLTKHIDRWRARVQGGLEHQS